MRSAVCAWGFRLEELVPRGLFPLRGSQPAVLNRFGSLWRLFRAWVIEHEKRKLLAQMTVGSDGPPLDFVVLHLRRVADIAGLEITASEAGGLTEQGRKLLDAISGEPEFAAPPYVPAVVQSKPDIGLPWLDRGMTGQEIEGALKWIRVENPELDLAGAYRKLHEKHPELFGAPLESHGLNDPSVRMAAPLIGNTSVPEDSGFVGDDRLIEILNQR
jgi:hypothetical protein